jgi:hypothetical protein
MTTDVWNTLQEGVRRAWVTGAMDHSDANRIKQLQTALYDAVRDMDFQEEEGPAVSNLVATPFPCSSPGRATLYSPPLHVLLGVVSDAPCTAHLMIGGQHFGGPLDLEPWKPSPLLVDTVTGVGYHDIQLVLSGPNMLTVNLHALGVRVKERILAAANGTSRVPDVCTFRSGMCMMPDESDCPVWTPLCAEQRACLANRHELGDDLVSA